MQVLTPYQKYSAYNLLIGSNYPFHWKLERNRNLLKRENLIVGDKASEYKLLSLTTKGVIARDMNSGKGKFPKDFDTYQVAYPGQLVFCLFDIDETPRTVGIVKETGMLTGAYDIFTVKPLVSPHFLYYYYEAVDNIKALRPYYSGLRKVVKKDRFMQLYIPIPPKDEQERIVEFLNKEIGVRKEYIRTLERELELISEKIENLLYFGGSNKENVIRSWGKSFPSGWQIKSGKELFVETRIKNQPNERLLSATQDRGIVYKDECAENYVKTTDNSTQKLVQVNDYVISLRSFQGGIEYSNIRGIISAAYVTFHLREEWANDELRMFYRFLFKSKPFIALLNSLSDSLRDGKSIKFSEIASFNYPIPCPDDLGKINALIKEYDIKKAFLSKASKLISEYCNSLTESVITGRVNVQSKVL